MVIISFIKNLFKKKTVKFPEEFKFEIGFEKWKDLKNVSPTFIYMLLDSNNLNSIAPALVYSDITTLNYITECADNLGMKDELLTLIKSFSNISIKDSNRMKAHIMNNLLKPNYIDFMRGTPGTGTGGLHF
jgi:hypothetical protein